MEHNQRKEENAYQLMCVKVTKTNEAQLFVQWTTSIVYRLLVYTTNGSLRSAILLVGLYTSPFILQLFFRLLVEVFPFSQQQALHVPFFFFYIYLYYQLGQSARRYTYSYLMFFIVGVYHALQTHQCLYGRKETEESRQ